MKKRNYKKGMALASTLLMFVIVTMLCTLMLSVSLYSSQLAGLTTENFRLRSDLEAIGKDFVEEADAKGFLEKYVRNHNYRYYAADGNVTDTPTNVAKTTKGDKLTLSIEERNGRNTLTVSTNKGEQLMKVVYTESRVGGVSTIELKSWNYSI